MPQAPVVILKSLYIKGSAIVIGRQSEYSLYDAGLARRRMTDSDDSVEAKRFFDILTITHVEEATGTVINMMKWDKASDFVEFRDSNQEIIAPVLGKFGPKGRMLKIAVEITARH